VVNGIAHATLGRYEQSHNLSLHLLLFCFLSFLFSRMFSFLTVLLPLSFCEIEDNASPAVEARSKRDGGPLVAQSRSTGLMQKQRGIAHH
jgi:hypothetical protein